MAGEERSRRMIEFIVFLIIVIVWFRISEYLIGGDK
jgi:hypothetical protein